MMHQPYEQRARLHALVHHAATSILRWAVSVFWLRVAAALPPMSTRPLRLATSLLIVLGLMGQLVLLWLAGEMLDLYVSAVDLWAELARKHLELTL